MRIATIWAALALTLTACGLDADGTMFGAPRVYGRGSVAPGETAAEVDASTEPVAAVDAGGEVTNEPDAGTDADSEANMPLDADVRDGCAEGSRWCAARLPGDPFGFSSAGCNSAPQNMAYIGCYDPRDPFCHGCGRDDHGEQACTSDGLCVVPAE